MQLSGRPLGDLVKKDNRARHLEVGEALARKVPYRLGIRCLAVAQDNGRGDLFPQLVVRLGEGDDLLDGRMIHKDLIDLARRDLFAAAIDDFL